MNYRKALLISFIIILGLFPRAVSAATTVTNFISGNASVPQYGKYEATFTISRQFPEGSFLPYYFYDPTDTPDQYPDRNSPYGIDGISIDAIFTAPSGKKLTVPAFYFQEYIRSEDTMTPTNNYFWKIRFAPEEIGEYRYYIQIQDNTGTSRYPENVSLSFLSTPSSSRGFIRVSPRDSRFLEFSNGESFIPNSAGRQWWGPGRTTIYEKTFSDFKTHAINFTRIWDQNDGFGLTVEGHFDAYTYPDDAGLGGQDDVARAVPKGTQMNQRGNAEEDFIIEQAEQNGVYIQLCAHSDPYWIWDASVHDEGWNTQPVEFDDVQHINYWKRNYRYRIARWGYSTAILAWETWNEHGHIQPDTNAYRFYQIIGQYLLENDPYQHLRTTSQGSQAWSPAFWSSPAFDIANYHDYMMPSRYDADLVYDTANFVYRFAQCLRMTSPGSCELGLGDSTSWQGPPKPIVWGELDTGTLEWNEANPQPKATHDMRWAGLFSPIGTTAIDWYWDAQSESFTAVKYAEAKIAADFFHDLDYAGKQFTYLSTADVHLTSDPVSVSDSALRVLAMRAINNQEAYAWVQNKANARWDQAVNSSPLNATFTIPGMADGTYTVEFWNTYSGQMTMGPNLTASGGNITIPVSDLTRDVAIKVRSTQGIPAAYLNGR
jgi:hypothetical protein